MTLSNRCQSRLCDYFAVCGLDLTSGLELDYLSGDDLCPPIKRSYKSKVLEHYPSSVPGNSFDHDSVCMLSLPKGLQFATQKLVIEPSFHSFVVTREDGSRYYGFSYIFYEEVKNKQVCNAMHTLQSMYLTEVSSSKKLGSKQFGSSKSLPKHFKVSTLQPSHYYDCKKDILYVTKTIVVIMQLPFVTASYKFLSTLHKYAFTKPEVPDQLSLESYIYNFLYEIPLPQPGRSVQFQLVNTQENLIIQRPISIEELPLLDFSLRSLFTLLSVDVFLQLFTCILLEHQVLLCSSKFQTLMLVAECLTSLLFPFAWQHVYVPILPNSLHHFLDAPVPFIMGLHSEETQVKPTVSGDWCYLNIDNNDIEVPEEMPTLPRLNEFRGEICRLLKQNGISVNTPKSFDVTLGSSSTGKIFDQKLNKYALSIPINDADCDVGDCGSKVDLMANSGMDKNDEKEMKNPGTWSYEDELKFNNSVRETFLGRFVNIFYSYEHFVILPSEKEKGEWLRERETMQNFDKATFLSDQATHHLPFLSQFLETQMFASFIDSKILATFNEIDPNLRVFDKRIKNARKRTSRDPSVRKDKHESCEAAIRASRLLLEKRFSTVDIKVPLPVEVVRSQEHFKYLKTPASFPQLDASSLNKEPVKRSKFGGSYVQWSQQKKQSDPSREPIPGSLTNITYQNKINKNSTHLDHSPAHLAQANWNFVEKLLKDCKLKTNRMVLEKMGAEGLILGKEQIGNVEENTLIASLCDLLERVWSHAVQQKHGKSALWNHLLRYQEYEESNSKTAEQHFSSKDFTSSLGRYSDRNFLSENSSPAATLDSRSLDRKFVDTANECSVLKPLPLSITFDIRNVQAMTEIKSQIGYARAWIRLALEKKLLSWYLHRLLSAKDLLKSQYKRNAFLRCEEEREQFLFHLLSLNAVDYLCFTNTYLTTKLPYRVIVFPSKKSYLSTTITNAWVAISGTNGETSQVPIPKGTMDFIVTHKNLGMLTSLRVGQDNDGTSSYWMLEKVLIRCEVTGHTFRFPCGRYLGKGVDDGSSERLLIAELIRPKSENVSSSNANVNLIQCRSPLLTRKENKLSLSEIQHMIGDSVNSVVKYFHRFAGNRQRENRAKLTPLLCGEMGLVHSLEQAFLYGFKTKSFFVRNLYLWDYFLRVKEQFDVQLQESRFNRHFSKIGSGSLDRRLQNINLGQENAGDENKRNPEEAVKREIDHIPRSLGLQTYTLNRTVEKQSSAASRSRVSSDQVTRPADSNTQIMQKYCELVSKIENCHRAFGKDGKFQRFICFAVRDHILHRMLAPMASSRPTVEMYDANSFLRSSELRSFLYDILKSLEEYTFYLESSITSGIEIN
ncbi:hypothetical protein RUM44_004944 [Polyplax serrata]|uniref:DENN domain-containing protein 5B n=1 Tax=Polyplax serrata TaxID=468196 RepID=A0ABR1AY07_POLSC